MPRTRAGAQSIAEPTNNNMQLSDEQEHRAFVKAQKYMDSALNLITPLANTNYRQFQSSIKSLAYAQGWPTWILDANEARPATADISYAHMLAESNAFQILKKKCESHRIADVLEDAPLGDAKRLWDMIRNFHHPKTMGGLDRAMKEMYQNATMEKTDLDILQWKSHVLNQAEVVKNNGGSINDKEIKSLYLSGLLDEFEPIRASLARDAANLSLTELADAVVEWAQTKNFDRLTWSTKHQPNRANTFLTKPTYPTDPTRTPRPNSSRVPPGHRIQDDGASFMSTERPLEGFSACPDFNTPDGCKWGELCFKQHLGQGHYQRVANRAKSAKDAALRRKKSGNQVDNETTPSTFFSYFTDFDDQPYTPPPTGGFDPHRRGSQDLGTTQAEVEELREELRRHKDLLRARTVSESSADAPKTAVNNSENSMWDKKVNQEIKSVNFDST